MVPQTLLLNSFIYEFEGRRTQLDPEVLIVPILLNNLAGSRNLQINYTTHILRYASSPGLGTFCTFFFFLENFKTKFQRWVMWYSSHKEGRWTLGWLIAFLGHSVIGRCRTQPKQQLSWDSETQLQVISGKKAKHNLFLKQLNTSVWNGVFRHTPSSILLIYYLFLAWGPVYEPCFSPVLFLANDVGYFSSLYLLYSMANTCWQRLSCCQQELWSCRHLGKSFLLLNARAQQTVSCVMIIIIQLWIICLLANTCPFSIALNSGPTQMFWETILL